VATPEHQRGHEVLGHDECLRLLSTATIGRLAYTEAALPAITPVFFRLGSGEILVPACAGSPLLPAVRSAVVAFQADSFTAGGFGWSVTVVGPSRVVPGPVPGRPPDTHGPALAQPGATCHIAVRLALVRGWRAASEPAMPPWSGTATA
jgi:uncharacterized protein